MMVIYCYLFWTGSPQRSNLWNSWWCTCSDLLQNWQRRKDLCQEASYWWQCWHRTLHCKSYRIIMIWVFHKYQLSNIKSWKLNCASILWILVTFTPYQNFEKWIAINYNYYWKTRKIYLSAIVIVFRYLYEPMIKELLKDPAALWPQWEWMF